METTFASLTFNVPEFRKSKEEVVQILRDMQAQLDKFHANTEGLLSVDSLGSLRENRKEAAELSGELNRLGQKYNNLKDEMLRMLAVHQQANKAAEGSVAGAQKMRTEYEKLEDRLKATIALMRELGTTKGIDSEEYRKAAQEAANLKQQLKDINALPKPAPGTTAAQSVPASSGPVASSDNLSQISDEQATTAKATGTAVSDLEQQEAQAIVTTNEWAEAQRIAAEAVTAGAEANTQAAGATDDLKAANEGIGASVDGAVEAYSAFSDELQNVIQAYVENDLALRANKKEQGDIQRSIRQTGTATQEQTQRLTALRNEEIRLTQSNRDLNTTIQAQVRAETTAAGSADNLRARIALLTQQYNSLTVAEQQASRGQALASQLNVLNNSLTATQAATSRTSAAVAFLSRGFAGLSRAAALIPGLGLSGIFLFAFQGAKALYEYLVKDSEALTRFKENFKLVNDVVAEGNKNAGKEIADLKLLYEGATNVTLSIKDRLAATKALKDEFPDTFKQYNDEAILNGKVQKSYDDLTDSIVKNARATAAKAKIDEIESKQLDIDFQRQKIQTANDKEIANAKGRSSAGGGFGGYGGSSENTISAEEQKRILLSDRLAKLDEQDKKSAELYEQEKFLIAFVGEDKITKTVVDKIEKRQKDLTDKEAEYLKQLIKARIDGLRAELEEEIKFNEAVAKSDDFGQQQRLKSSKIASEKRIELIKLNAQAELDIINATNAAIQSDKKIKPKDKVIANEAADQNRKNIIAKENRDIEQETIKSNVSLATINKEYRDKEKKDTADAYRAFSEQAKKNNEDEYKDSEEAIKARLALRDIEIERQKFYGRQDALQIKINQETEEKALTDKYKQGKLSKEQYEKQLKDIQKKYAKEALEASIKAAEAQLKLLPPGTEEYNRLAAAIAEAKNQVSELADASGDKLTKALQTTSRIVQQVSEQVLDIYDSFFQRRMQQIEQLEARQQASYDKEKENIENSVLDQKTKDEQLKTLEATREQQRRKNLIDEAVAERKKAQFEKAIAITRIIIETAKAVAENGFYTPTAILAGVLGAAQVIAVAAQPLPPLPQFRMGTPASPEGPAIVGEAGRELRIEPTGEMSFTPSTAAVTYLRKNTEIVPAEKVEPYLRSMREFKLESLQQTATDDVNERIRYILAEKTARLDAYVHQRDAMGTQADKKREDRLVYAFHVQTKALLKGMKENRPEHPQAAVERERERLRQAKRMHDRSNWGTPFNPYK